MVVRVGVSVTFEHAASDCEVKIRTELKLLSVVQMRLVVAVQGRQVMKPAGGVEGALGQRRQEDGVLLGHLK